MRKNTIALAAAVVSALALETFARSLDQAPEEFSPETVLNMLYAEHIKQVHLGELAKTRTEDGNVRAFADSVIAVHRSFSGGLTGLAAREKVQLDEPVFADTERGQAYEKTAQELRELDGAAFNREYARQVARDHAFILRNLQGMLQDIRGEVAPTSIAFLNFYQPRLRLLQERATELAREFGGNPDAM